MSASTYLEDAWARTLRGGGNGADFAAPAVIYGKLHTGDPGEAGTANAAAETTRKPVEFAAPAGGVIALSNLPSWTMVAATESYTHLSLWDAANGGNCLGASEPFGPKPINAGDTFNLTVCTWTNQ